MEKFTLFSELLFANSKPRVIYEDSLRYVFEVMNGNKSQTWSRVKEKHFQSNSHLTKYARKYSKSMFQTNIFVVSTGPPGYTGNGIPTASL
jgi:hypothetical protein